MENDRLLNVMRDTIRQYVEANKTKNIDIHCRLSWNVRNNCQKKT